MIADRFDNGDAPNDSRIQRTAQAQSTAKAEKRSTVAFRALLVLSVLYYARPEDWIRPLSFIPMSKIAGGIALGALMFGVSGTRAVKKWPVELKVLMLMLGWLTFTIPFAWWKGGAFETVFFKFSKGVIVAILVSMIVTRIVELRKLLWVQAASLTLTTIISIILHNPARRMGGALGGIFHNPNDLAINIALNWPLCFVFFLFSKKAAGKLFWAGAMFVMVVGNFLTYSRSGFLSLILAAVICLWFFGVKGKRGYLLGIAAATVLMIAVAAPIFGLSGHVWMARMESIVATDVQDSHDAGSKEAREQLLEESLVDMATHPMVGVGPGNFQVVSGHWHVAHNTFTELGAEAGLPALFLFVLFLGCAFRNLRRVFKSPAYEQDVQIQLFAGAMFASLVAYLLGAFFSDTQYELFPYFMVAYTTALYHLACVFPAHQGTSLPKTKSSRTLDRYYEQRREPAPAPTR